MNDETRFFGGKQPTSSGMDVHVLEEVSHNTRGASGPGTLESVLPFFITPPPPPPNISPSPSHLPWHLPWPSPLESSLNRLPQTWVDPPLVFHQGSRGGGSGTGNSQYSLPSLGSDAGSGNRQKGKDLTTQEMKLMIEGSYSTPVAGSPPLYSFPPVDTDQYMLVKNIPALNTGQDMDRENRWKGKEPITEEMDAMGIMCSKVNNEEAPPVWVPQFFSQFTAAGTMYNMQFGNAPQTLLEIDINPPQTSQAGSIGWRRGRVCGGGMGTLISFGGETDRGNGREREEPRMHETNLMNNDIPVFASPLFMLPPPHTQEPVVSVGTSILTRLGMNLDPSRASQAHSGGQGGGGGRGRAASARRSPLGGELATPASAVPHIGTSRCAPVEETRSQTSAEASTDPPKGARLPRRGGRRKRSKNFTMLQRSPSLDINQESMESLNPFIHYILPGEDIVKYLSSIFSQLRDLSAVVQSALGYVSTANIQIPAEPDVVSKFEGRFELMKITAGSTLRDSSILLERSTVISVILRDGHGNFFGGEAAGPLIAASPVLLIYCTFRQSQANKLEAGTFASQLQMMNMKDL
ncbi:hypothetical protein Dimus_019941 [Dionaea muscipula]